MKIVVAFCVFVSTLMLVDSGDDDEKSTTRGISTSNPDEKTNTIAGDVTIRPLKMTFSGDEPSERGGERGSERGGKRGGERGGERAGEREGGREGEREGEIERERDQEHERARRREHRRERSRNREREHSKYISEMKVGRKPRKGSISRDDSPIIPRRISNAISGDELSLNADKYQCSNPGCPICSKDEIKSRKSFSGYMNDDNSSAIPSSSQHPSFEDNFNSIQIGSPRPDIDINKFSVMRRALSLDIRLPKLSAPKEYIDEAARTLDYDVFMERCSAAPETDNFLKERAEYQILSEEKKKELFPSRHGVLRGLSDRINDIGHRVELATKTKIGYTFAQFKHDEAVVNNVIRLVKSLYKNTKKKDTDKRLSVMFICHDIHTLLKFMAAMAKFNILKKERAYRSK